MAGQTFHHATDTHIATIIDQGWHYVFIAGDQIIAGDAATDIVEHLIDGYATIPPDTIGDETALVARATYATRQAQLLQETLAAYALRAGEWELDADLDTEFVLIGDRSIPLDTVTDWDHPVPLVLLATDYAPYTERTPPDGNILWIDPYNDTTLLTTMADVRLGRLFVREETESAA